MLLKILTVNIDFLISLIIAFVSVFTLVFTLLKFYGQKSRENVERSDLEKVENRFDSDIKGIHLKLENKADTKYVDDRISSVHSRVAEVNTNINLLKKTTDDIYQILIKKGNG